MRFIQIVFFIILISCGNTNSSENQLVTEHENTEQKASTSDAQRTEEEPIMGGPTKILLTASNVPDGRSYLIASVAGGNFRMDSTMLVGGKMSYELASGYPQGLYYASLPNNEFVQMFLGKDQEFELAFDGNDMINSMKVTGSRENQIFYTNLKFEQGYNPKFQELTKQMSGMSDKKGAEYMALEKQRKLLEQTREDHLKSIYKGNDDLLFVNFKRSGQNPKIREDVSEDQKVYFYRKEFWDNVDFNDRRLLRTPVISNKLSRYIKDLTPQDPDSIKKYAKVLIDKVLDKPDYFKFFTNWIAIQYEPAKTTLMDAEAVFVYMIQNYFTRGKAFWSDSMEVYALQQRANEMAQSLIGLKGPDVVSTDQNGNTKSIYEKTADYIIVYMYNPTCEHCLKETPLLVEWYNKNKSKGVDVFAIAIDTDEEEWKAYIKEKKMNFTNVFDPTNRSIYAKYYVNVTPEIYVLNKDRTIIGKNLKVFQIDQIIERDKNGK